MSFVLFNTVGPGVVLNRHTKIHCLSRSRVDHESPHILEFAAYPRVSESALWNGTGASTSIVTEPSRGPLLNLLTSCGSYQDRGEGYITLTSLSEATRLPPKRAMLG